MIRNKSKSVMCQEAIFGTSKVVYDCVIIKKDLWFIEKL